MDVTAGEVREHVAAEHARVRLLLDDVVRAALQTSRKVGHHMIRDRLVLLRSAAERAIDVEERELVPLLRASPSGDAKVDQLRARHVRALSALRDFEDDVAAGQHRPCDVVARADEIVTAFEAELVDEDLLDGGRDAEDPASVRDQTDAERASR